MKQIVSSLINIIIICAISAYVISAYSEEDTTTLPMSIKEIFLTSLTRFTIPENYDIDRYILNPNEEVEFYDLTFTLQEVAADPSRILSIVRCDSADPDIELREWYGAEFDLPDVLSHLHESIDRTILYVSMTPTAPYVEQALDAIALNNSVYRYSASLHNYSAETESALKACILNQEYNIDEVFTIDIIHMENAEWHRITGQIIFSIPAWPVIDKFELPEPITFKDMIVDEAAVYLTPISTYIIRSFRSISGENMSYKFVILPKIQLAEKLPKTLLLTIVDDSNETIYQEKWSRGDGVSYKKQ